MLFTGRKVQLMRSLALLSALIMCFGLMTGCGGGKAAETAETAALETPVPTVEPVGDKDWWERDWYGWWCIKDGSGIYEPASDVAWDCYAEIDLDNENKGVLTLWDTGTEKDEPLAYGYVSLTEGESSLGCLVAERVTFFPDGVWNEGSEADTMEEREQGWHIEPMSSTVSHFDEMIEISAHYQSPDKPEDGFDYYIYLRPWGKLWDDVREGDTSACLYSDMMPIYYDNWYLSLLYLGHERALSSFDEGVDIINNYLNPPEPEPLDPADKAGADGRVDIQTLRSGLEWCKANASYNTPYDEIAARFGVHGKAIESLFEGSTIYRWWATEDAYVQITFTVKDDLELWNVTQYNGL